MDTNDTKAQRLFDTLPQIDAIEIDKTYGTQPLLMDNISVCKLKNISDGYGIYRVDKMTSQSTEKQDQYGNDFLDVKTYVRFKTEMSIGGNTSDFNVWINGGNAYSKNRGAVITVESDFGFEVGQKYLIFTRRNESEVEIIVDGVFYLSEEDNQLKNPIDPNLNVAKESIFELLSQETCDDNHLRNNNPKIPNPPSEDKGFQYPLSSD